MYNEFLKLNEEKKPAVEYDLVQKWVNKFGLGDYYEIVSEKEFNKRNDILNIFENFEKDIEEGTVDPVKAREIRDFQEGAQSIGMNMAVVMFMLDALQYFDDLDLQKIKLIAFEIAQLGITGISPDKEGYKLNSIPQKSFSGYHLLAYYYVSWAIAIPEMLASINLPYENEYEIAKQMKGGVK